MTAKVTSHKVITSLKFCIRNLNHAPILPNFSQPLIISELSNCKNKIEVDVLQRRKQMEKLKVILSTNDPAGTWLTLKCPRGVGSNGPPTGFSDLKIEALKQSK